MEYRFNRTGAERKALVKAIGEITGSSPAFMGPPSFGYEVASYIVDREGALTPSAGLEQPEVDALLKALEEQGFVSEKKDNAPDKLSIDVPLEGFTDTALSNLEKLVASKAPLIKKAITAEDLPIEQAEERLCFPWFSAEASADEMDAYAKFILALCEMAKNQKRVTATEKPVESEKYAFRCFLLRLGFIGKEYAQARRILLYNLSGSGSFRSRGAGDDEEKKESADFDTAILDAALGAGT